MKYSVNAGSISSFVKIVNFVRQFTTKDQIGLMDVYMKELKINTPLSYFVVGKFFCKIQIGLMAVSKIRISLNLELLTPVISECS